MAIMTRRDRSETVVAGAQPLRPPARAIGSAVLSNLLNPKLIVFFAFLPQIVPPHAHHEVQRLLLLSGVFMAMTLVVLFSMALPRQPYVDASWAT